METISLIFPEVKVEIPIEGMTFDSMEQIAFDTSRQIGLKAMEGGVR
jgi:hypothetical protein